MEAGGVPQTLIKTKSADPLAAAIAAVTKVCTAHIHPLLW